MKAQVRRILVPRPPTRDRQAQSETIKKFLGVMEFELPADAANAVAAALTVLLRHLWPGSKPPDSDHCVQEPLRQRETVTVFIQGTVPKADLLYESIDWPMQSQVPAAASRLTRTSASSYSDNVRLDSSGGRGQVHSLYICRKFCDHGRDHTRLPRRRPAHSSRQQIRRHHQHERRELPEPRPHE